MNKELKKQIYRFIEEYIVSRWIKFRTNHKNIIHSFYKIPLLSEKKNNLKIISYEPDVWTDYFVTQKNAFLNKAYMIGQIFMGS